MDWIFENFNFLAIVGIAFAAWLKARADAKAAEREEREAREAMGETEEETFGPEEDWRQLEPTPPQSQPPPLVFQSPAPPPLPGYLSQAEAELARQTQLQEKLKELRESRAASAGGASAAKSRTQQKGSSNVAPVASTKLSKIVRQRSEVRRAVILREVLGPPLSLR